MNNWSLPYFKLLYTLHALSRYALLTCVQVPFYTQCLRRPHALLTCVQFQVPFSTHCLRRPHAVLTCVQFQVPCYTHCSRGHACFTYLCSNFFIHIVHVVTCSLLTCVRAFTALLCVPLNLCCHALLIACYAYC